MSDRVRSSLSVPSFIRRYATRGVVFAPLLLLLVILFERGSPPVAAQTAASLANGLENGAASTQTTTITVRGDLGDAPDSTNHYSHTANTAYPGVPGRFPTVWDAATGSPSGPLHFNPSVLHLGSGVSSEADADQLPDEDTVTNILNNGGDNADNDQYDDGWLNRNVTFEDCRTTTLKVRIYHTPNYTHERAYLNVWFDGNRDGDWEDQHGCPNGNLPASEWIVRDFVVNTTTPTPTLDLIVPTWPVLNEKPDKTAWVRFTLSEEPAVRPTTLASNDDGRADGRGPSAPNGFQFGETEDYLYRPITETLPPGQVVISKTAQISGPVSLGGEFIYHLNIKHFGNSSNASIFVTMTDPLPEGLQLVDGPWVTEIISEVEPLVAEFESTEGPQGAIVWRGKLSPGAHVRISFKVKVVRCPQPTPTIGSIINTAYLHAANGQTMAAPALVYVVCTVPPTTHITLTKILLRHPISETLNHTTTFRAAEFISETELVAGEELNYLLVLVSSDTISQAARISDTLPLGVVAVAVEASDGEAHIIDAGRTVIWNGVIGSRNSLVWIRIRARVTERVLCNYTLTNIAKWWTHFAQGQSNPVTLRLACYDLGDAPDSTNHYGAPMTAYPSVQANYPTVFAISPTLRGPLHQHPQPLHLGPRVSFEREADLGFDADGVNNIQPWLNRPNLDKADDGLVREKLSFSDCKRTTVPVLVTIAPSAAALLSNTNAIAYLNVWLDSNRDGDWKDVFECPAETSSNAALRAREHIVIDYPINVAALGVGMHLVNAPTSGPVSWPVTPTAMLAKPAWLRLTLSERPAHKPFSDTLGVDYGDGRGHDTPFKLGETEDYLLPRLEQPQPDPAVEKRGYIYPHYDLNAKRWQLAWGIEYRNIGTGVASDVHVVDTFDPSQKFVNEFSHPHITPTRPAPNVLDYNVGTLTPGHTNYIVIQTAVPFTTPPGAVFTNTVVITSSNDTNGANNTDLVTVTIPLLPPIITDPIPGTTCEMTFTIKGKAQFGAVVDLYINNVKVANDLPVDALGNWSYQVVWLDGEHSIFAVAEYGGMTSLPSAYVVVKVDTGLSWSPISLTFTDAFGHVTRPRDSEGRMDETGWRIRLRPYMTYTVSVKLCCTDPNAVVTLQAPGVTPTVQLTDPDGNHIYTATFKTGSQASLSSGVLRLCVTCYLIRRCSDGTVLIDPEGVVFDVTQGMSSLIAGASVTCYQGQTSGGTTTYDVWDAGAFGQINPQTTASDGYYSFFTPAGTYQIGVTKSGYQSYRSMDIIVTNTPVEFNVPLTPIASQGANYTVTITARGFEPPVLQVPPGAVVAWLNMDSAPHTTTSNSHPALTSTDGWDSGVLNGGSSYLRQMNTLGTYTYIDQNNPTYSGTIVVAYNKVYLPLIVR
jgi:plastocyanin